MYMQVCRFFLNFGYDKKKQIRKYLLFLYLTDSHIWEFVV